MIRRCLAALVVAAVAIGTYMPYSHGISARAEAIPEHLSCAGHETAPDTSHVSECLSDILVKNLLERADMPYEPLEHAASYAALSSDSYYLPPAATRRLVRGLSPPSPCVPESAPAAFIAVTVLLV